MKNPLIRYHVLFQYYIDTQNDLPNLVTKEDFYDTYKKAKKEATKFLLILKTTNKKIEKALIEPVLLAENLA